jgi:hypothetical protein
MRRFLIAISASIAMTAGAAFAQEFTTRPRVAPQTDPTGPSIEQNSNSSWYKKFMSAQNKLQLISPFAPRQYGSGAQVVVADPRDPRERANAVRLFSIAF